MNEIGGGERLQPKCGLLARIYALLRKSQMSSRGVNAEFSASTPPPLHNFIHGNLQLIWSLVLNLFLYFLLDLTYSRFRVVGSLFCFPLPVNLQLIWSLVLNWFLYFLLDLTYSCF
jgi:hypothetical protein